MVGELEISQMGGALLYRDSEDPKVAAAGISVCSERKWHERKWNVRTGESQEVIKVEG